MIRFRGTTVLAFFILLFAASPALAQETWRDSRYQLSMQQPSDWTAMSETLLSKTNAQVLHVTGRGFIAGYSINQSDSLLFPYMLVQFKPYSSMLEAHRPKAKLDEHGQLQLICNAIPAFGQREPLPETVDTPQFIDGFGTRLAQLIRLDQVDGRFDFTGVIPHQAAQASITYHTHGIIGKEGIGFVTVFTVGGFADIAHVIDEEMRSLAFAKGFGLGDLPDVAPLPPVSMYADTTDQPATNTGTGVDADASAEADNQTPPAVENPADMTALIGLLGVLGLVMIATIFLVWFASQKKARKQRERRLARRERMLASQQPSAQVNHQPRPARPAAPPTTARSHGSTDRHTHGTTRS